MNRVSRMYETIKKKKKDMLFKSLEPQKEKRQESSAKNSNGLADLATF